MATREHMSPYSGRVDVLHTHRAVLPRHVLNTLKTQTLLNNSLMTTKSNVQESGEDFPSYLVIIF